MSNKKCGNCGNEIINDCLVCPACKEPLKNGLSTGKGCLITFIIVILTPLILSKIISVYTDSSSSKRSDSGYASSKESDSGYQFGENEPANHFMAYSIIEDYVKQKLIAPSTAKFPGTFVKRDHIKHLGSRKYRIDSWVDSENSFSAKIRTRFVGEIQQTGQYEWKLISLKVM